MELLGPSFWDSVLDLVLDHHLVGAFGEGHSERLLVQLIKLIVELGNHCLDISAFFLSIQSLEDGYLHVLL